MSSPIEKIIVDGKEVNGKECTKCHELKPLRQFGKDERLKSGYRSWCKKCERRKTSGYDAKYDWANCHKRKQFEVL